MAIKIKGHTIDLGKEGKFGPGRDESFLKAVEKRKDSKSLLEHLESKGFIEDTSKKRSSKKSESKPASSDDDKKSSKK